MTYIYLYVLYNKYIINYIIVNPSKYWFDISRFDFSLLQEEWSGTKLVLSNRGVTCTYNIRKIAWKFFAFSEDRDDFFHIPESVLRIKWVWDQDIQQVKNQVWDILRANEIIENMRVLNVEAMIKDEQDYAIELMRGPSKSEEAILIMLWLPTNVKF